jgi:hypothetical protein
MLMNPKVPVIFLYWFPFAWSFHIASVFTVALAEALARVASLEAKLKSTSKALKDANAAKTSTEKAAKAAEA